MTTTNSLRAGLESKISCLRRNRGRQCHLHMRLCHAYCRVPVIVLSKGHRKGTSLQAQRSPTQKVGLTWSFNGAGDGNRTRIASLEGWNSSH